MQNYISKNFASFFLQNLYNYHMAIILLSWDKGKVYKSHAIKKILPCSTKLCKDDVW